MDGARHAALLVHRHDEAERAVILGVLEQIEPLGDTDAIVRPEARPLRFEVFLAAHELDGIAQRIIVIAVLSDADHIHVPLQDRARRLLEARRRRRVSDDVVHLILHDVKALLRQIRLEEIADALLLPALARDGRQLLKLFQDSI